MSVPGGLDPDLADAAAALDDAVHQSGLQGRFTSGFRSRAQQQRLYRSFLSGRNPYPVAPPGFSAHEYGWAFDYVVIPFEWQPTVGSYWNSVGGVWGGSHDPVHFELPGASAEAKRLGEQQPQLDPEFGPTPAVAELISPGPWWAFLPSYVDILKGGTHYTHEAMCAIFGKNWC